jgi:hypothetical protein
MAENGVGKGKNPDAEVGTIDERNVDVLGDGGITDAGYCSIFLTFWGFLFVELRCA